MSREKHPKSRWIKDGPTPRYTKQEAAGIAKKYGEPDGWHKGAKVSRR